MDPTHIIWDWNGTLLDDVEACVSSINCMLAPRNLPTLSTDRYRDLFDFPVKSYYLALGFDMAHEEWDSVAAEFHRHYAHFSANSHLRPGVQKLLTTIHALGLTSSVLSACEQEILDRMLGERGILPAFEHVHGLDNLHAASKLERGHALIERLPHHVNHIVLVGDTLHDHEVARELGCDCILLTGGHNSERRLRTSGRRIITSLDQLPDLLTHPNAPTPSGE
jgi:phosphoglycolate phosphatase